MIVSIRGPVVVQLSVRSLVRELAQLPEPVWIQLSVRVRARVQVLEPVWVQVYASYVVAFSCFVLCLAFIF